MISRLVIRGRSLLSSRPFLREALIVCAALAYPLAFQGSRGLWEPDEGRYVGVANQMLRSGDYFTPAFNDEMPHLAKPPLTYWSIASGVALLGRNEWGARLANALAFAATLLVLRRLGARVCPGRPALPAIVYATFAFPFAAANMVTTDTLLVLWETLAVLGFAGWWQSDGAKRGRRGLWLMWAGFGLAFLTKGPPGLLPLLVIGGFVVVARGWRSATTLVDLAGVAVFAVVGLGWYALIAATRPGVMRYFLQYELAQRLLTDVHDRNPQWYGPFLAYGPALIAGTLPWTWLLLRGLGRIRWSSFSRAAWRTRLGVDPWSVFLGAWFLVPLAVFVASRSRQPLYVLPLFVPLALATARVLGDRKLRLAPLLGWTAILLACKWGVSRVPDRRDDRKIASQLMATGRSPLDEIVFVDMRPAWGLGFYLDCEVEPVVTAEHAAKHGTSIASVAAELAKDEPRTVWIVAKSEEANTRSLMTSLGYGPRTLTEVGPWVVMDPNAESAGSLVPPEKLKHASSP